MNFYLFDGPWHDTLKPLTLTRTVGELRIGILTIKEKWEKAMNTSVGFVAPEYMQSKYPAPSEGGLFVSGALIPSTEIVRAVHDLQSGQALWAQGDLVAIKSENPIDRNPDPDGLDRVDFEGDLMMIRFPWDIFRLNGKAIDLDWELLGLESEMKGDDHHSVLEGSRVYVEEGAEIRHSVLNADEGPVYIGKNARVLEGTVIRGPFVMCDNAVVKMGAKIYGPTTLGPYCKVGGEINNSVLQGYSNKGHDGFMGNSVIGEWCNIGADTNTSNLKNNYGEVKVYSYPHGEMKPTGLQFCGLIMGDHSKTGINTMLNTGTVVGVSANVFGGGFPPKYIPSFSWGGADGFEQFRLEKAYEVAERMMERRDLQLTGHDRQILEFIFSNRE